MRSKKVLILLFIACLLLPLRVNGATIEEVKSSGKLTLKSIPPTKLEDAYMLSELVYEMYEGYGIDTESCNDDYTECEITNYMENTSFPVTITYEYDADVKTVVDGIMHKIPEGGKIFYLNDVETIKYYLDLVNYEPESEEDELSPLKYSSEYNKFIGYKNFVFEPRMGYDDMYSLYRGGTASFTYDGTVYGFADGLGVRVNSILYVDDDETDIEGTLMTRLSKYFNIKSITKDDEITLDDLINDELEYYGDEYDTCIATKTELDAVPFSERDSEYSMNYSNYMAMCSIYSGYETKEEYIESVRDDLIFNEDEALGLYNYYDKVTKEIYVIEFEDGTLIPFFVSKDSSKVFDEDIEVITSDTSLGIEVSTSSVIPLDTLIQVAKLTSGADYEKITKILNNDNIDMFDIKLFSKATSEYITKLDDGSFEVKLPISDALKGKNLVVYYVNDDDTVEEFEVTVDGDFAVFNTTHFSIYTLAEGEGTTNPETTGNATNNPQTADTIITYIVTLFISLIGMTSGILYLKKKYNY